MKILSVVGARPQFVKLAPIAAAASDRGADHVIVHTGQHYDAQMSQDFFDRLSIPAPDVNLAVGSGSHGVQTGSILAALDPVLERYDPDWVLVYGDTNSTLAAAISAAKLHIPLAHLEAGLRSFNRRMPEEHNRVLADHSADLCLAPTEVAMRHLASEGLAERSVLVGDVMTDVVCKVADEVRRAPVQSPIPLDTDDLVLATIHRPSNTDDPERLRDILHQLRMVEGDVYLPAHPRLAARMDEFDLLQDAKHIHMIEPLGYHQLVQALTYATAVITDSGGLQKESYLLGVPTTTLREETEWTETLEGGWNALCPDPQQLQRLVARTAPTADRGTPFGDGSAAQAALDALLSFDQR